jgi:hypothetical protein
MDVRRIGIAALGLTTSLIIGCDNALVPQNVVTESTEASPDQIPKPPGSDSSFTFTTDVCRALTQQIVQSELGIVKKLDKDVSGNVCTFGAADHITLVRVQWGWSLARYNQYTSVLLQGHEAVPVSHVGDGAVFVRATNEPNPGNQIVFKSGTGAAIIMVNIAGTTPEPESNLISFAQHILAPYQH